MRAKEFIVEDNPNNPERYEYPYVDFLRDPHFTERVLHRPPDDYFGIHTEFKHLTLNDAKRLIDKLAAMRVKLNNLVKVGKMLYVIDRELKFSILIRRGYDDTRIKKNIYYLKSFMNPTIANEFVWPDEDRRHGNDDPAPRFDINTHQIVTKNSYYNELSNLPLS